MRKKWKINFIIVICTLLIPLAIEGNFKASSIIVQPFSHSELSSADTKDELGFISEEDVRNNPELLGIENVRKITQIIDMNQSFKEKYDLINPIPEIEDLTGENITIAILDSGINDTEWINTDNIINQTSIPPNTSIIDNIGHGTQVGSIIAKIAPHAKLISIRVADNQGIARSEWVEEGLRLAESMNVSIIHASIGSQNWNSIDESIIADLVNQNISLVFAAGNSGPYGNSLTTPAIYKDAIAVGMAFNESFIPYASSLGPRPSGILGPDLVAPGVYIPSYSSIGEPANVSGTSFAAPFVTGSLALLKEEFSNVLPVILKAALLETANKINNSQPIQQGNGLIDINNAYQLLKSVQTSPIVSFAPREISSDYSFFGQSINGLHHTYRLSLYSSHEGSFELINQTSISPFIVTIPTQETNFSEGFNHLNLSLLIPLELAMEDWKRNLTFKFIFNETIITKNFSINIKNRYPGGRVLFYQGYDNDTFISDGPTGTFSQLALLLELFYGMQVKGAIKPSTSLEIIDPLYRTSAINGKITSNDLIDQDILILADIELGISAEEVDIIESWVNEGNSLLVLSYPSYKENGIERLSNQTAVNILLNRFDMRIEDEPSSPAFDRFSKGKTEGNIPIFTEDNLEFEYNGTTVDIMLEGKAHVLATALNTNGGSEELTVAGYWEDPVTMGKVVVFGGLEPFSDLSITSVNQLFNIKVVSQIFRWLISDQQAAIEIVLTNNPTVGSSTQIQLNIEDEDFLDVDFNGTIIEANGSYTQILFNKPINTYVGSWSPKIEGNAILWLNIPLKNGTPTNGVYLLPVVKTDTQSFFFIVLFGGFILLAVGYYWIASRRTKSRLSIEEQINLKYNKPVTSSSQKSIETYEICPKCRTPRFNQNSKYCFRCGKEL